jgi:mRNA-degrading endonuclease RelE of RelBE toxin-antitoxin system
MQTDLDETKWEIDYQDEDHEREIIEKAYSTTELKEKWGRFVEDVTQNPYFHPKHQRIVKLKDSTYPKGSRRYRNDPIRVVYYPEGKTKKVYPLDVGTATDIRYKKRSSK